MQQEHAKMPHLEALGLDFNPFPVVPDAHNYFTTESMNTAISDIMHCIDARKGFILISGEVGLGKTTLSRLLLLKLAVNKVNTSLVLNTFLQSGSLIKAINKDFNIHIQSNLIEDQLDALNNFLLEQYAQDKNCVIVIDDAQQLNLESLELIRQLSNLETNQNKLLQIVLVAQGEILSTLGRQDMRQLKSRIALSIKIEAFTLFELKQYIQFRLARAGSSGQIDLEKNAYKYLHKVTKGLPRQINLVMDRCLYVVAAFGANKIDVDLIRKAYLEICIDTYNKPKKQTHYKWLSVAAILLVGFGLSVYQFKDYLIEELAPSKANVLSSIGATDKNFKQSLGKVGDNNGVVDQQLESLVNVKQRIEPSKQVTIDSYNQVETKTEFDFLNQFGLTDLESIFVEAVQKGDFSELSLQLSENSEYKLLLGKNLIAGVDNYKVWKLKDNENAKWLTFWKPQLVLNAFYQGYYSEDILQLQSLLKDEGFYASRVDGIVGDRTISAISKLQSNYGIKPSGFPDDLTLYQLQIITQNSEQFGSSINQVEYYKDKINSSGNIEINSYALDNSLIND